MRECVNQRDHPGMSFGTGRTSEPVRAIVDRIRDICGKDSTDCKYLCYVPDPQWSVPIHIRSNGGFAEASDVSRSSTNASVLTLCSWIGF